jgi:hypothetical protein
MPGSGGRICMTDNAYEPLVSEVRNQLEAIDSGRFSTVSGLEPGARL